MPLACEFAMKDAAFAFSVLDCCRPHTNKLCCISSCICSFGSLEHYPTKLFEIQALIQCCSAACSLPLIKQLDDLRLNECKLCMHASLLMLT